MRYLLPLALPVSLLAWNETGHKAIALLAYENLNKTAREAADALLREHPHYATWKGHAFQEAAYWPDVIRRNPQYDHPTWHYINVPFSPDGTPLPAIDYDAPGVLSKIREFRRSVGDPSIAAPERAIQLAWILHLVGDVHNPLHTVARVTRTLPKGDRGGNDVYVRGAHNLHAYWDALLGDTPTDAYITKVAQSLGKAEAREKPVNLDERQWVDQGVKIAKASVYTFGDENGTKQDPLVLPDSYRMAARQVARARAALAGYRLAALLNEALAFKQ